MNDIAAFFVISASRRESLLSTNFRSKFYEFRLITPFQSPEFKQDPRPEAYLSCAVRLAKPLATVISPGVEPNCCNGEHLIKRRRAMPRRVGSHSSSGISASATAASKSAKLRATTTAYAFAECFSASVLSAESPEASVPMLAEITCPSSTRSATGFRNALSSQASDRSTRHRRVATCSSACGAA